MSEEQHHLDHMPEKTYEYNNIIIPPHWLEETIIANGIHQHFYRTGGDKLPLILLHGFSENALCWSRVAKALENDYEIIMIDARGHGLSSGPETGYSQELLAQDLVGLIEELGIQRPILFGHSNGALTAAQIAAIYPEFVQTIVLEDPPWGESSWQPPVTTERNEPWPGFTAWYNSWIAWHKSLRTQTPEERVASSRQFLPPGALDWPEEELFPFLEAQAQFNLDVLNYVPFVPTRTPWQETVQRIACPILLLTGNPQRGAMVTPQEAQKIAASWRKGKHVSFAEVGHMMHHELKGEQFDNFIQVIKAFLQT
jgi:pimeloyl-ACP methyl ester carboxylesterase